MKKYIETHLSEFKTAIEALGGSFSDLIIDSTSSEGEIKRIEAELGMPLPSDLKEFALNVSRRIEFDWTLPDDFELPDGLDEIFSGRFEYCITDIPVHEKGRASWQSDCFPNEEDSYDAVWHNKLGFHHVPNRDYLGFDSSGQVVYLSHDDGEGHGVIMASSFTDLMMSWIPLGCPGPEDWQWLSFISDTESGIDPHSALARKWIEVLGKKL